MHIRTLKTNESNGISFSLVLLIASSSFLLGHLLVSGGARRVPLQLQFQFLHVRYTLHASLQQDYRWKTVPPELLAIQISTPPPDFMPK